MPLIRAQKEELVGRLTEELKNSRVAIVFAYTALNMQANDSLRSKAFDGGAKVKMLSNNLLKLILKGVERDMDIPSKQLALAYGFQDEVAAAKTLVDFAKETDALEILGGWIDGAFFDTAQVKTLASLPSKETLQAQLVGRLGGMIGSLAYSLNYPLQKFAFVVEALKAAKPVEASAVIEESAEEPKAEASAEPEAEVAEAAEPVEDVAESAGDADEAGSEPEDLENKEEIKN